MPRNNQQKSRFVISILLILLSMQISSLTHASEHLLNATDLLCVVHLEADQFSHLLTTNTHTIIDVQKRIRRDLQYKSLITIHSIHNYHSRAPPIFIL